MSAMFCEKDIFFKVFGLFEIIQGELSYIYKLIICIVDKTSNIFDDLISSIQDGLIHIHWICHFPQIFL